MISRRDVLHLFASLPLIGLAAPKRWSKPDHFVIVDSINGQWEVGTRTAIDIHSITITEAPDGTSIMTVRYNKRGAPVHPQMMYGRFDTGGALSYNAPLMTFTNKPT